MYSFKHPEDGTTNNYKDIEFACRNYRQAFSVPAGTDSFMLYALFPSQFGWGFSFWRRSFIPSCIVSFLTQVTYFSYAPYDSKTDGFAGDKFT